MNIKKATNLCIGIFGLLFVLVISYLAFEKVVRVAITKTTEREALYISIVAIAIVILLAYLLWALFRRNEISCSNNTKSIFTVVSCIFIIALFLGLRIYDYNKVSLLNLTSSPYYLLYKNAEIGSNGLVYSNYNSLEDTFSSILSIFMKLLGNSAFSLVMCQTVILFVCLVILFFSVAKVFGRIEAVVTVLGVAVLPAFINCAYLVDTLVVRLFLFAFLFGVISICSNAYTNHVLCEVTSLFVGLAIGAIYTYDSAVIVLLIIAVAMIFEASNIKLYRRLISFALLLISFGVMFFFDACIEMFLGKTDIALGIANSIVQSRMQGSFSTDFAMSLISIDFIGIVLAIALMYFAIMFVVNGNRTYIAVLMLLYLFFEASFYRGISVDYYQYLCIICLLIIAGSSIRSIFLTDSKSVKVEEVTPSEEAVYETDIKSSEPDEIIEVKAGEKLINPLPVPKPHEKKVMDYDYDVSDYKLYYDVELDSENMKYDL